MMTPLVLLETFWWILPIVALLAGYKLILRVFGIVMIPEDCIGIVNKKFVLFGAHKALPDGSIIALRGEAGLQADALAPGVHFWLFPWQYSIDRQLFMKIGPESVGIVEARDGKPLQGGRVLGRQVACDCFQDARAFLAAGGERGPQITIIPPGTYRINGAIFSVTLAPVLEIPDNMVGIVTTKDGKQLPSGEIAGYEVPGHNLFQDAESFITSGGYKGLQEQVILAGRYFLNPRFATVEVVVMTEVKIAHAGVVIAFVGAAGKDVSGAQFKHGNLVSKGQKGVCVEPLDPGKYPINPYTHRVVEVPTANVVLNWADDKSEAHKLDANLSTITVRSFDGFKFNLDVSQIIHIPRTDAPMVIARFGSVANLVTQVLEPTIGNYFRNAAQGKDAIAFLKERGERQNEAKAAIEKALQEYNVGAVDTLIGDIVPPEALMKTLTDRKIAEQEKITFETQKLAEETRKELEQARALATTQARVVDAERKVQIAEFDAQSSVKKAQGDAESKTINAEADAKVLLTVGEAEGKKIAAVGTAEANVIQKKTDAVGRDNFAVIEIGRALAAAKIPLVPQIVAGGSGGAGGHGGILEVLLATLMRDVVKDRGVLDVPKVPNNS
jgi:uncharacterized membrane protein YqiK